MVNLALFSFVNDERLGRLGPGAYEPMSYGPPRQVTRLPFRVKNVFTHDAHGTPSSSGALPLKPDEVSFVGTPPKKRAVPLDGVHVRNVPESCNSKRAKMRQGGNERAHAAAHAATGSPTHSTIRIDRSARVSQEERYQREQHKLQSQRQWKAAFGRAFPKFVFYLDSMDDAQKRTFSTQIAQLGACVEDFFSRSVTHVVTTRPIPAVRDEKENVDEAKGGGIAPPRIVMPVTPKTGVPVPLHSDRNPMDEWTQPLPANDFLLKAQHFGMKIWRAEKLEHILSILLADDGVGPQGPNSVAPERPELFDMLMQEKLHGTTERDPLAMRSDVHYFGKNSYHVLVTDATGEHRPIIAHEYDKHAHEAAGKPAPWPELHGEVEGRGLFVVIDHKERRKLAEQQAAPLPQRQTLRRAASMHMPGVGVGLGVASPAGTATPTLMASDNSMAIASTVVSTSTTLTSQTAAATPGLPPDKRVLELHRRLHTPAEHGTVVQRMLHGLEGAGSSGGEAAVSRLRRSRSTGSVVRKSATSRVREKKPGHCENCRCRFDDFYEHTRSRRHRKFALDESNFVSIDELLQRVQREPLPMRASAWSDYADVPTYPEQT